MKTELTRVKFTIDGPAVPQGRPRVTRFGTFFPKKSKEFRTRVVAAATEAMHGTHPMQGPLVMYIHVVRKPPASWPKKKKEDALAGRILPTSRAVGDCDNLAKGVMDGCSDAGTWQDDSQVAYLHVVKEYGKDDFTEVLITKIGAN